MFRRKYKKAMPHIIEVVAPQSLLYNKKNPRGFLSCYRTLSFAFNGTNLITFGENKLKTHPKYKEYADDKRLSIHAEIDMILKLERMESIKKVTDILVIRGAAKFLNSFPCKFCYPNLQKHFNMVRLWFYMDNNWCMKVID